MEEEIIEQEQTVSIEIGTKLYKGQYTNKEYADTAVWCNHNNAHLKDKGEYYEVVENAPYVPTIQEQIEALENTITARNIRAAIQGDEFALNKLQQVESQIAELREQLPQGE